MENILCRVHEGGGRKEDSPEKETEFVRFIPDTGAHCLCREQEGEGEERRERLRKDTGEPEAGRGGRARRSRKGRKNRHTRDREATPERSRNWERADTNPTDRVCRRRNPSAWTPGKGGAQHQERKPQESHRLA